MRIMHLSWEFPPKKVGGLAQAVHDLVMEQAKDENNEIHVITCDFPGAEKYERHGNLHIHRFSSDIPSKEFLHWAVSMNMFMKLSAADVISKYGRPNIVHAHDWLSAIAAFFVKYAYRTPLISTIHSTEYGRRRGIHEDHQRMIHELESKLVYESWRVVCCSHFMKYQVMDVFNCPGDKIDVIPNGVVKEEFDFEFDRGDVRSKFAAPDQRIVLCVGRMVPEKGFDVLLGAARFVVPNHNVKFICVGDGYMKGKYLDDARFIGVYNNFYFTGYLDDRTLKCLFQLADVVVVPSRYEPFGIVALEAMAAKTPVVVADTGGLSEIVWHDHDGLKVWPGHSESLAWGINRILGDQGHANWLINNAYKKVTDIFNWKNVARRTREIYLKSLSEFYISEWQPDVQFTLAKE